MFWRIIYDTFKWIGISFFPAIGFAILAGIGVGQTFPESKPWLTLRYQEAIAVMIQPSFWVAALVILLAWAVIITLARHNVGEVKVGGDTHIHHHYSTLQERLAEAVEPRSIHIQPDSAVHAHITGAVAASEGAPDTLDSTGVLGLSGLYIGYVFAAAGHLKAKHYLEFAIVGYNGAEVAIQITEVAGRIRAGTGNLRDYVKLSTPLFQGVLNAEPGKEFVFQMRQDVSVEQADEYLAALEDSKSVGLDLRELNIIVSSVANPQKRARLPLWDGVNLRRRDDIVSNRNMIVSLTGVEAKVSLGTLTTRVDEATEGRNA